MRPINRLSALKLKAIKKPGRYADGGGLYLYLGHQGARAWVFRYRDRITGKLRDMGLGAERDVTLERAREKAAECRSKLADRVDPLDERRTGIETARLERARRITFGAAATAYIAAHRSGWRNAKHADQWQNTLDTYAAALLPLPVAEIDTGLVLKALEPIWQEKTETATRVRQRIEAVLDWATVRGHRHGDNPARWRGHLDKILPKPGKLKALEHHAAVDYADVADFVTKLRAKANSIGARALELGILTAARPGEVCGAQWSEIDLRGKVWLVPRERMKTGREHRVPLSGAAVALLRALPRVSDCVFPGAKLDRPITSAALLALVKELAPGRTVHGFRSTFRDWCADQTAYPREIAEAALAHTLKDKTEAAYRRSDLFGRRARLMHDWATFCTLTKRSAKVTPIRKAAGRRSP